MNILIYIPYTSQSRGGIRQYAVTLLKMLHHDGANQYYIYHDLNDAEIIAAIAGIPKYVLITSDGMKTGRTKMNLRLTSWFNSASRILRLKNKKIIPDDFSAYCAKQGIQIIHCPFQYIPTVKNVKLITTMHDVQEIHYPEFFTAEDRAYRAAHYLKHLRNADSVIVSYQHIKDDLIKYFNVPVEKIKIILLQMDKLWFQKYTDKDLAAVPADLQYEKYILYPANAWQHKNHLRLLEAVALLRDEENIRVNLICTGDIDSGHGINVQKKRDDLKLNEQVKFLGIVEEKVLFTLYKKALAVVIPTLYEAGSFPLMESLFLHIPVICSNTTSLPETMGNDDFIFDPTDSRLMALMIKKIYTEEEFRKQSVANSIIQVEKLKQPNALKLITDNYKMLLTAPQFHLQKDMPKTSNA